MSGSRHGVVTEANAVVRGFVLHVGILYPIPTCATYRPKSGKPLHLIEPRVAAFQSPLIATTCASSRTIKRSPTGGRAGQERERGKKQQKKQSKTATPSLLEYIVMAPSTFFIYRISLACGASQSVSQLPSARCGKARGSARERRARSDLRLEYSASLSDCSLGAPSKRQCNA